MYNGWSQEGIIEYNDISKLVKEDRRDGESYEETFRNNQLMILEEVSAKRSHLSNQCDEINKRKHTLVDCYDDFSDSGDSDHETRFSQHSNPSTCYSINGSNTYPNVIRTGPDGEAVLSVPL